MAYRQKFISIWKEVKKIPGYMGKASSVDQLNDTTLFPFFLHIIKNFSSDYRKNKSHHWDYLISIHDLKNLKGSIAVSDAVRQKQINYLIEKYNERLLFYSIDKENPWIIDYREKKFITLHKKRYLEIERNLSQMIEEEIAKGLSNPLFTEKAQALERKRLYQLAKLALLADYRLEKNNLCSDIMFLNWYGAEDRFQELIQKKTDYDSIQQEIKEIKKQRKAAIKALGVHYSKEVEAIECYSTNTIWEKVNSYISRSKILGFFSAIWSAVSGHANLLSWINFLLLFFSLSIYSYPVIFILILASIGGYLLLQLFFLVKRDSQTLTPRVMTAEAEQLLECVKLEVMNEEKNKSLTHLLYQHIVNLTKNDPRFSQYVHAVSIIQKKINLNYPLNINIENSSIYQYLKEVYPKTQFISSVIINLTGVLLATYLLTWAAHSFLIMLNATALASLIVSPIAVGIVILVAASFFLIRQLLEFKAREDHYQQLILTSLNENCEYTFKDVLGKSCTIKIEKWKKFEYLQQQIELLEQEIKIYIDNKLIDPAMRQFYFSFGQYFIKGSIYKGNDEDKLSSDPASFFTKVKKCLNRIFALLGGGLYGYNLTQQIVWSRLCIDVFSKVVALPLLVFFCH